MTRRTLRPRRWSAGWHGRAQLTLLAVGLAAGAALPTAARAGTYPVYVCTGTQSQNNALVFSENTNHISQALSCGHAGVQVWSNNSVSGAQAGGWWFTAPTGTSIVQVSSDGKYSAWGGWVSHWATNPNGSGDPYASSVDCQSTSCNSADGEDAVAVSGASEIGFAIWCHASTCPANSGSSYFGPAASANVYDATITINDPAAPTFSPDSGPLASRPVWVSAANAPSGGGWWLANTADDPGGVCSVRISLPNQEVQSDVSEDLTRGAPCGQNSRGVQLNLNPCVRPDGTYTISESARNPAGMTGYGPLNGQSVNIDCTPPSTTVASAPSSTRWFSTPQQVAFTGADNFSGVSSMVCNDGQHSGASYTETVSAQGSTTASCRAADRAANVGNTASATVNIDAQAPTVSFSGPSQSGWTSATALRVTGAEAQPLSGVASVSCSIDGAPVTVSSGATQQVKIGSDGTHTVTCSATSGAGVTGPSASYTVHVDSQPPTLGLSGGPPQGSWATTAQSVTVIAQDQPGLSGVSAIECTLGGQSTMYSTATVNVTVQPPGGQLICKAQDNAGNWSASQGWGFLIDNTTPTGAFLPVDPANPTLAQVQVADTGSGVAGVRIEVQTTTGWQALPTTWDAQRGVASATVPDDGSIPDGTHQLEALAWDVAGNEATITHGPSAAPKTVTLPLRIATAIRVGAGRVFRRHCTMLRKARDGSAFRGAGRLVTVCRLVPAPGASPDRPLRYGQAQTLNGVLKTQDGSPLPGATLTVTGTAPGWRARTLGTVITDGRGRFAYTVDGVASETVMFTYQGTDTLRRGVGRALVRVIGRARIAVITRRAVAGRSVRIGGTVLGGFIPSGGVLLQLQYMARGYPFGWAPMHSLIHTDRRGHFIVRFPLSKAARGFTYLFRAVIEQQSGWPFLTTITNVASKRIH
jgi:hypothetical protein